MKKALIVVDIQYDFVKGGALAVPEGETIIPAVNAIMPLFEVVVATQDWHPRSHGSFAANHIGRNPGEVIDLNGLPQVLWPVHCVQGTHGAAFVKELRGDLIQRVFVKGTDEDIDSYSGFFDNGHRKATGLGDYLREQGVEQAYVVGLAADYCVKFTALDALGLGFETFLVEDATKGVNLQPGDVATALADMQSQGVKLVRSADLLAS